ASLARLLELAFDLLQILLWSLGRAAGQRATGQGAGSIFPLLHQLNHYFLPLSISPVIGTKTTSVIGRLSSFPARLVIKVRDWRKGSSPKGSIILPPSASCSIKRSGMLAVAQVT